MTPSLALIGLPLVSSPLVYFAGRADRRHAAWSRIAALLSLLIAWVLFVQSATQFSMSGALDSTIGMITLRIDGISLLLTAVVLTLATFVTLYSDRYMMGEMGEEKYYALVIAMSGAMIGLACAADLFNLWVWFELMTVSSFLLVAFYCQRRLALEAGVKYLVQSAVGSVLVLLGVALIFAVTGTLRLDELALAGESLALIGAGGLFVIGFGVKIALVPMHTWLPDAHSQAPSGISTLLSGVVIEAGLIALLRVIGALAGIAESWGVLLLAFAAINMLFGNLMALRQKQVKRLLAFSSLSHIGYMLLGFGIAFYAGTPDGAAGGFFHLLTHGLMKGLAFLAAGALLYGLHLAHERHDPLTVNDLAGAGKRYPLAALSLSIAVLGLGGLPPLAGFMSKWQIFTAGFETQDLVLMLLVIFAALNSVLSLAYYAPLVNRMYRDHPSSAVQQGKPIPLSMQLTLIGLAVLVVAIGVLPSLVSWLTEPAGSTLMLALGR